MSVRGCRLVNVLSVFQCSFRQGRMLVDCIGDSIIGVPHARFSSILLAIMSCAAVVASRNHSNERHVSLAHTTRASHKRATSSGLFHLPPPLSLSTSRLSLTDRPLQLQHELLNPCCACFAPRLYPQELAPQLQPQAAKTGSVVQGHAGASPSDSDDANSVGSASNGQHVLRRRPSVFNSPPPAPATIEWKRLELEGLESCRVGSSSAGSRSGDGEASEDDGDEDSTTTTSSDGAVALEPSDKSRTLL